MWLKLAVACRSWIHQIGSQVNATSGGVISLAAASSPKTGRVACVPPSGRRISVGTSGAIYVEFLIVFLPVLTMFLGLMQLAFLFAVRIAVEHAAVNAARTAAVVIGDDDKSYQRPESRDHVQQGGGRYAAIRRSAILSLAPLILDDTLTKVEISFPPKKIPGGDGQDNAVYDAVNWNNTVDKVRVRVEVRAACKIMIANRIICGEWWQNAETFGKPAKRMYAEAMFPYQGARYEYP